MVKTHGTVLSYDRDSKYFKVVYDTEDEIYSFLLLEDLEIGELCLISSLCITVFVFHLINLL